MSQGISSALGLDFGTSTTVVAAFQGGKIRVLADNDGEDIIHSVVAFTPTGQVKIGKAARSRTLIDATNTIGSVKRILGQPWHMPDVASFRTQYPYEMERSTDGTPLFITRRGKLTPLEITETFLAHVREFKSIKELHLENVVVAVPERADLRQQEATIRAVQNAGYPTPNAVSEPAAAVLAHFFGDSSSRIVLVYDWGGGTFDTAIVKWDGIRPTVLSSSGDSYLGGDDIDLRCAEWASEEILRTKRWDVSAHPQCFQTLRFLCEQAKVRLSIADPFVMNLSSVDPHLEGATLQISRNLLGELAYPLIKKTFDICNESLSLIGMNPRDLNAVVMVGGTTYMPIIRNAVSEYFSIPLVTSLPADRVVAMGASLLAHKQGDRLR